MMEENESPDNEQEAVERPAENALHRPQDSKRGDALVHHPRDSMRGVSHE